MAHFSRRRFVTLAAGAAGLACVPRKLLGATRASSPPVETWPPSPRRLPSKNEDRAGPLYLLVSMPGDGDSVETPEKYRHCMHVCYPPTRRPCWCGGWHTPDDPVDLVLVVGTPQRDVRLSPTARGLFLLPQGESPIRGTTMNFVECPTRDFGRWAARAIDQVSEALITPGLISVDFEDLLTIMRASTELRFDYATSNREILDAGDAFMEKARPWLATSPNLLVHITGGPDLRLLDVNDICSMIADAAPAEANIIFGSTIADETVENVVGAMGG